MTPRLRRGAGVGPPRGSDLHISRSPEYTRLAAGLQAFLAMPILFSLNHRKDPIVELIVLFLFDHCVRLFRQEPGWMRSLIPVLLGMVAVYPFRSGRVLPFLEVMLICFVLANRNIVQGVLLTAVTVIGVIGVQVAHLLYILVEAPSHRLARRARARA